MFTLRFDMRAPTMGAPASALYRAAIEMSAWSEDRGAVIAVISEHHGTTDNHLPSPFLLASAIAARTERLRIMLAAIIVPFYDPVRLAEDISVLDLISGGRMSYVLGVGHRREEYDHLGVDWAGRGRLTDERVGQLLALLRGDEVDIDGRSVSISPTPQSEPGPQFLIGGGSVAAARRAGRFGLGLLAQADAPGMRDAYAEACLEAGHEPGWVQVPDPANPTVVFVADDVDRAWEELGPHLLHDAMTAASYRHGDEHVASISTASTVEELRAGHAYRVLTIGEAVDLVRAGRPLPLLPLCGGLAPEVAWTYLERAARASADAVAKSEGGDRDG